MIMSKLSNDLGLIVTPKLKIIYQEKLNLNGHCNCVLKILCRDSWNKRAICYDQSSIVSKFSDFMSKVAKIWKT